MGGLVDQMRAGCRLGFGAVGEMEAITTDNGVTKSEAVYSWPCFFYSTAN